MNLAALQKYVHFVNVGAVLIPTKPIGIEQEIITELLLKNKESLNGTL
jgi:hypothetical protein